MNWNDLVPICIWEHSIEPQYNEKDMTEDEIRIVLEYTSQSIATKRLPYTQTCKICMKPLGCEIYTDGTHKWPDSIEHYIRDHNVRLPRWFVEYARKRVKMKPARRVQRQQVTDAPRP